MTDPAPKHTILVVDDETANLQKLKRTFIGLYRVLEALSGEEAYEIARREPVDLIITDQKMPRLTGIELLKKIMRIRPDAMRFILTGYTEVEDLIDAINEGHVYRYITKPWEPGELRIAVRQALERLELERENRRLTEELKRANERLQLENLALKEDVKRFVDEEQMVVESKLMKDLLGSTIRVAAAGSTVLITGETGTGKEMLARYIHRHSRRARGIFVAVNCGAIPRELVESEFFGYKKGAFSGAAADRKGYFQVADGGTLFLDEIGEAPPELQVKMLRVLQGGEIWPVGADRPVRVDVRIVASTNRDLQAEVAAGRFREDLFFRLNVFSVRVPALRERREDIRPLAAHFLQHFMHKLNRRVEGLEEEVSLLLEGYEWPGNIRQLQNEVERLVLLAEEGHPVGMASLSPCIRQASRSLPGPAGPDGTGFSSKGMDMRENLDCLEQSLIREALQQSAGNRTRAAKILGITRQSLLDRMKRFAIE